MIFKILLSISLLSFCLCHVSATGCYDLHQSQLKALNERLNQMIDTISSFYPKSIKKLPPSLPTTSAPSVDYIPSTTGHETSYYVSPATYPTPPPTPQMMHVPPPFAPPTSAVAVTPPWYPNFIWPPLQHYTQPETGPQAEYPFSSISPSTPHSSKFNYQNEQSTHYAYPIPMSHLTPPIYPPGPYSLIQPVPSEYIHPYLVEHPSPAPIYPSIPAYAPGPPLFPLPVQVPPGAYTPTYPPLSELPQRYL